MTTLSAQEKPLLGFLLLAPTRDDGYIEGLMITTLQSYPLAHYCAMQVGPIGEQRILWGAVLEEFMGVHRLGRRLLRQSSYKPALIVVAQPCLSEITEVAPVDAVCMEGLDPFRQDGEGPRQLALTPPVQRAASPAVIGSRRVRNPDDEPAILQTIEECASRFDFAEVFGRIKAYLAGMERKAAG